MRSFPADVNKMPAKLCKLYCFYGLGSLVDYVLWVSSSHTLIRRLELARVEPINEVYFEDWEPSSSVSWNNSSGLLQSLVISLEILFISGVLVTSSITEPFC